MSRETLAAILASAFAVFGLWVLAAHGGHPERAAVVFITLFLAVGHFLQQDQRTALAAVLVKNAAIGLAVVAAIRFAFF
jgi:hypothetical protein